MKHCIPLGEFMLVIAKKLFLTIYQSFTHSFINHSFVHRDIKPENFMIGFPKSTQYRTIHLIDFGLCKRYRNPHTMEHFSPSSHDRMVGSVLFMSCNSHFQLKQSRRDDIESLAYLLLYFLNGKNLPWSFGSGNNLAKNNPLEHCRKVGSMKQSLTSDQLFENHLKVFANLLR